MKKYLNNDFTELEQKRKVWERLEFNLDRVKNLPWEEFNNIDSAKIPQALDLVQVLHQDIYEYPFLSIKSDGAENKRVKRPSAHLNNGLDTVSIFYGGINTKPIQSDEGEVKTELKPVKNIPRFITAILEYLFGTITFYNNGLYLVNGSQFELLSAMKVSSRYKTGVKAEFRANEIVDILEFVQNKIKLKPVKEIKTSVIACKDFQIDLGQQKIIKQAKVKNQTYFKVFDLSFSEVMNLIPLIDDFLETVIDDDDSLHNAKLQPIYTMLVACREITKTNFFISKSGVRTGKGLRHSILSKVFESKKVVLDELAGAMGSNAWASFDGGELLLVTEAGAITNDIKRFLKILATESSYQGRKIGNDFQEIQLSGVLAIDSNEKVLLDREMNSRAVNMAFKNRPKKESDEERKKFFSKYWEAFTEKVPNSTNRAATIKASLAMLLYSFDYWKSENFKLKFKHVEMNNFADESFSFDDVQLYLLEEGTKGVHEFIKTGNDELQGLLRETYRGSKRGYRQDKMTEIGVYETNGRIITDTGYKPIRKIIITNHQLFRKATAFYLEEMMTDTL